MDNITASKNMSSWFFDEKRLPDRIATKSKVKVELSTETVSDFVAKCDELFKVVRSQYDETTIKELYDSLVHLDLAKKSLNLLLSRN